MRKLTCCCCCCSYYRAIAGDFFAAAGAEFCVLLLQKKKQTNQQTKNKLTNANFYLKPWLKISVTTKPLVDVAVVVYSQSSELLLKSLTNHNYNNVVQQNCYS